tara:strand:- start:144 stop:1295 length:1152 start_codon:yes stop_codon:yes gene_type:complete
MKYHNVQPQNLKHSYGEYDQLDFDLVNIGKIKLNTIRFCFGIESPSGEDGGQLANPTTHRNYYYDNLVGGHSFIDSITTEFSQGKKAGIIENIQSYPRYVKMAHSATSCNLNQMNSAAVCEGRASSLNQINNYVRGEINGFADAAAAADTNHKKPTFAVKPKFCLNSATSPSAQPELSGRQSGSVRVSLRLARNEHVYFGEDADGLAYQLSDCRLTYISVDDDGQDEPIFMNTKINIKKSVNADATNMSVRIPAVVQAVSASFLDQEVQNDLVNTNTLDLQRPEAVSRVVFSFNDAMNRLISYELGDDSGILHHYLRSFSKDIDANQASMGNLKTNDSYGIGANFGQFIDLQNQRFSINIQSRIGGSNKVYIMYAYFHSLIQV